MTVKRICVYGCSGIFGGTERYLLTIYQAIDRNKIQFDFLFPHNVGDVSYRSQIESLGGKIYKEYYKNSEKNMQGYISPKELFYRHPEWSGIYINWQSVDTAYRLIIAAKKAKLTYRVIHAHNSGYNRHFGIKDKLYEIFFHLTKKKYVTDYLACSELAGKWLFHLNKKKIKVIPNPVDFNKFAYSLEKRNKIRDRYHILDHEIIFGFCGRLVEQKNPKYLIDIFKFIHHEVPMTKLLIVGDGVMKNDIEILIRKYNLENSILMVGAVSNVEDYMQAMDCFIIPSLFEGFGIVLLEAQAAGLTCFASKDVIPNDTNLTGNVHFIGLEEGPEQWANIILSKSLERYDKMNVLLGSDYVLEKSALKLMNVFN